jgi:hypothetical protein
MRGTIPYVFAPFRFKIFLYTTYGLTCRPPLGQKVNVCDDDEPFASCIVATVATTLENFARLTFCLLLPLLGNVAFLGEFLGVP